MLPMVWVWIGAIVLFGVIEAATVSLVSIWFVAGAVVALIAAALGAELWLQILLFVIVSAVAVAATRPLLKKFNRGKDIPTNADRVVNKRAKVTETIDNENATGAVFVDGKTWTARSADTGVIPVGREVQVERIEGVKLIVKFSRENMEVAK